MKTPILLILFSLLSYTSSFSQGITAPGASHNEMTQYPNEYPNDPIYYFETINNAQLTISPMGGVSFTFQWYKYNPISEAFDILLKTENGSTSSLFITEANGYRVQVDDGASIIQNYYCWTFQPNTSDLSILFSGADQCTKLTLEVTNNLTYYNHNGDNAAIIADHNAQYAWSSDPSGPIEALTARTITIDAPYPDTQYNVNITNSAFGTNSLSEDYTARAVNAEYETEIKEPASNQGKLEGTKGSAPLQITFTPMIRISDTEFYEWYYEWNFGDGYEDTDPTLFHTYRNTGSYEARLEVEHPVSGCSQSHTITFEVTDFEVLIPEAFTPFSSIGQNDEFKVHYNSVKTFSMIIYNRWGRKVFQTSRPDEGWDGRIGSRKAEPGVYFYQVDATGYNGETPISKSGPVHLIIMNH